MNTVLLLAIFLVALVILYQVGRGSAGGQRTYRAELVQRGVIRTVDSLAEDAIHIWRLRCAGLQASRRAVVRRGEMTEHRWNKAVELLETVGVEKSKMTFREGADHIERYVAQQRRLAAAPNFVPPWKG